MMVKTKLQGRGIAGLLVGMSNVRRYFSKRTNFIELQLDHLNIQCVLCSDFWTGCAEIHDPRLCSWLEAKHPLGEAVRTPVSLALIPAGENAYRIQTVQPGKRAKPKTLFQISS
jgi:hypothetical protein